MAERSSSSAAALIPRGKPSEAPTPHRAAPTRAPGRPGESTTARTPLATRTAVNPKDCDPAVALDLRAAEKPPECHGGHENPEASSTDGLLGAVPVDEREGEPVVGDPFTEGEGEHEQTHREGPRLAPGRPKGRPRAVDSLVLHDDRLERAQRHRDDQGDH